MQGEDAVIRGEMFRDVDNLLSTLKTRRVRLEERDHLFGVSSDSPSWGGFETTSDLLRRLRIGVDDTDLVEKAVRYAHRARTDDVARLVELERSVAGGCVLVPAMAAGCPKCMVGPKRREVPSKTVRLAVDCAVNENYSASDFRRAGMVVIRAINALELAGYSVGFDAVYSTYDDTGPWASRDVLMFAVPFKRPSQPPNIRRMLYPLTDVSFARGVGFGWTARCEWYRGDSGMGRSIRQAFRRNEAAMQEAYASVLGKRVTILLEDVIDRSKHDEGGAAAWVEMSLMG